jgi:hypothetical protein
MKKSFLKLSCSVFLTSVLLLLLSCATTAKDDTFSPDFNPAVLKTIGLFPITYDKDYHPPLPGNMKGRDLTGMITRQVEKVLTKKGYGMRLIDLPATIYIADQSGPLKTEMVLTPEGYETRLRDLPAEIVIDDHLVPFKIKPAPLAKNCPPDIDGLLQIHVTFHFGINLNERSGNDGPFSRIYLNAIARLIDKKGQTEVWRKSGNARPFNSGNFTTRLNYAVYTLVKGLFENFPDKN